jgi:hypothetical protein
MYYKLPNSKVYFHIWKKSNKVPEELYNPIPIIKPIKYKSKIFNVIRDDLLIGGSKQRAIVPLLEKYKDKDEFGYAGPVFGYAQIALAYACKLLRKQAIVFVEYSHNLHPFTKYAQDLGAKIIKVNPKKRRAKNTPLKEVQEYAEEYSLDKPDMLLLPFGLDSIEFNRLFVNALEPFAANLKDSKDGLPATIWTVAGSATLINVLYEVFPDTNFNVVQVGKTIWPDQIENGKRTKLFVAPEKFWENSKQLPPYPSVNNYDAKSWQFIKKYGKNKDYIWNVGRDI